MQPVSLVQAVSLIKVRRLAGAPRHRGKLIAGPLVLPCALGPAGIVRAKREGDGGTPRGRLRLLRLHARPDRPRPATGLPVGAIRPDAGWCDEPTHRAYNCPVRLPFPASVERMWREDALYDLVVELDWNRRPHPRPGRGSAIFMHAARPGFAPTAGCVALRPADLRRLLRRLGPRTVLDVR